MKQDYQLFKSGIYENIYGDRFKLVGISFLNGYPAVDIIVTSTAWKSRCDKGIAGIAIEQFLDFAQGFTLIKKHKRK